MAHKHRAGACMHERTSQTSLGIWSAVGAAVLHADRMTSSASSLSNAISDAVSKPSETDPPSGNSTIAGSSNPASPAIIACVANTMFRYSAGAAEINSCFVARSPS